MIASCEPFLASSLRCVLYQTLAYFICLFQTDGAGFFLVGFLSLSEKTDDSYFE